MQFNPTPVKHVMASPLGPLTLAAHATALVGVWFDAQKHLPLLNTWTTQDDHPVLRETADQLAAYFAGTRKDFDLPLDLSAGTPFQQRVWQALLGIASGTTLSYGTVSARIGQPRAVRAVGAAVGRNPLSIIVPCHRVVGADGALTGYAGGLDRKVALLQLESALF